MPATYTPLFLNEGWVGCCELPVPSAACLEDLEIISLPLSSLFIPQYLHNFKAVVSKISCWCTESYLSLFPITLWCSQNYSDFFFSCNHSDFSFPTISYISHLGFNKMWHTQEVFHDHPKHPQNLHASTMNLTLLLIVIIVIRLLGITLRAIERSPIPLPSWVLCTRSVTTEQYHLYKTCIYSYAIVYSCIPKGNEFTTDQVQVSLLEQQIRHHVKDYTDM